VTAAAGVYAPGQLPPRSRAIKLKARQHCGIPQGCAVGIVVRQDIDEEGVQEPGMTSAQLSPEETAERNLATAVDAHFQQAALLEQQATKTPCSRPKRRDENPNP
jgi:hypothetical protein